MVLYQLVFLFYRLASGGLVLHKLHHLPNNIFTRNRKDYIFKGLRELKVVLNNLKYFKSLKQFLIAFFLYSIGVQTVILLAGLLEKRIGY
jgi:UMF1 family MFS transporter